MVDAAVGEGYNVVVMPGYLFAGAIVECTSKYPDVKFIALDMSAGDILGAALGDQYDYNPANWNISDYYNTDNTYCAVYQEELPGYMAGYAAVKMGYTKLGFLGGMEVPAVIRYGYGFVQGADAAAAELGNASDVSIEYAYGGQFYGSSEITAAMDTWYQNGTEVVFACGGGIYTSAAEAAAKVDGKLIGVDSDQAPIIDAYADGMTVTSAMKGLTATVNTILDSIIVSDTWSDHVGQIENLGLASGDDMSKNYVQLSDSTQWSDAFTEDDYKALVADMFSGKIKVDNTTENKPDVSVEVNYREGTIM
jgi:basic membrane protein A